MNEENKNEKKPFNFWLFMGGIFIGLLILTSIILGIPYLLMK
ncbi:tRNA uridine 5-carboxymethylaminomethyl modification protein [Caminibacter sp.]